MGELRIIDPPAGGAAVVAGRALAAAIRERRTVHLRRVGDPAGATRVVRPHVLYDGPSGHRYVEGLQVAGPSSSPLPGWRCIRLSDVTAVRTVGTTFRPWARFDPRAERYRGGVIAVVGREAP